MRYIGPIHSLAVAALFALGLSLTVAANATIWYVKSTASLTPHDGLTWDHGFLTLTAALSNGSLTSGDQIWVANTAVYKPDASNRNATFNLKSGVAILGGFVGTETNQTDRDPVAHVTYLSGEINTGSTSDNSYHVVTSTGTMAHPNPSILGHVGNLDGFVIEYGNATGTGGGGGILINGSSPLIQRCHIESCQAGQTDIGGGVYSSNGGSPDIVDCVFLGNQCDFGAGFAMLDGAPHLSNCTFTLNVATNGGLGGGIGAGGGALFLMNCLIVGNEAGDGGGIWEKDCPTEIINCTFSENVADSQGGALFHDAAGSSESLIQNSIFWTNSAHTGNNGHEIYNNGGSLRIKNSDIYGGNGDIYGSGGLTYAGSNINQDPLYLTGKRLNCGSPCINTGLLDLHVTSDGFDVNADSNLTEATPDWDHSKRVVSFIDMGAYEKQVVTTCSADIVPTPCHNGVVNIDDLVEVITHWGNCPAAPADCPADIVSNWGVVDIDDLLTVITHWSTPTSPCITATSSYDSGSLNSVEDCMDAATAADLEPYSEEWNQWVEKCVNGLCAADIIECD
jgi:hypothetical protein